MRTDNISGVLLVKIMERIFFFNDEQWDKLAEEQKEYMIQKLGDAVNKLTGDYKAVLLGSIDKDIKEGIVSGWQEGVYERKMGEIKKILLEELEEMGFNVRVE